MSSDKKSGAGVIVGRFQVPTLHSMQRELFEHALRKHNKVLVLIGVAPVEGTKENPLDYHARQQMIAEEFPNEIGRSLLVSYLADTNDDATWSTALDGSIRSTFPLDKVTLYGGRDSFAKSYHGKHPITNITDNVLSLDGESGTKSRAEVGDAAPVSSVDWRSGYIKATQDAGKWGRAIPTVDIALFSFLESTTVTPGVNQNKYLILVGRKPGENLWRLPGGFIDPDLDTCGEGAAVRELLEETSISVRVSALQYISVRRMDDWRYRQSSRVFTTLYGCYLETMPAWKAGDDLENLCWLDATDESVDHIEPVHKELFMAAVRWFQGSKLISQKQDVGELLDMDSFLYAAV